MQKFRVVHYQRRPRPNANYSLEFIFNDVRQRLADEIYIERIVTPYFSNGILPRIRTVLHARANQGDITHVTGDIDFAAILLRSRTSILTVLDCGFVNRTSGLRRWILKWLWLKLPIMRVARVTTISTAAKNEIVRLSGCDERLVEIIPVAISPAFTRIDQEFNRRRPRILHVGTAINKNLSRLIEALREMPCELTIVGSIGDEIVDQLENAQIAWRNLAGVSRDVIVAEFRRCDLLAFCSTYEGFGMPILEAQATGRPVVTSNISSMPEVAGDAACLVDPFQVSSIKAGIERVINDVNYRNELIVRGFKNVKRFDPDLIAKKYLDLYLRIALGNR